MHFEDATHFGIFGHGKGSVCSQLTSTEQLQQHCKTLQPESATHEDVITAGLRLMVAVHGGSDTVTLAALRYTGYCTMSLGHRFQTDRLPPSDDAARMHAVRVHWQAVVWCTLGKSSIQAEMQSRPEVSRPRP